MIYFHIQTVLDLTTDSLQAAFCALLKCLIIFQALSYFLTQFDVPVYSCVFLALALE